MRKVVMGLSGGMDSATLLGLLLEQGAEVHCCSFYYGSKHNKYEREAASKLINYYRSINKFVIHYYTFDISSIFTHFESDLLLSGGDIPEGHYNDDTMKATVVPGRNMIFASIMAGLAESVGADAIALGVHSGDHHIYPDCRMEFIKALDTAVYLSTDREVQVVTPLLHLDKAGILITGISDLIYKVPYHLTRTCYKDQELSCGKCGSCRERLEAFEHIMMPDPIEYEK